jgi:competence protein ComEC
VTARAGQEFRLGNLALRVLWPDRAGAPSEDPNRRAVVLLASYGSVDVLLTADAESEVTRRLSLKPIEILKVAHHGSEDPGLPLILRRLRPPATTTGIHGQKRSKPFAQCPAWPSIAPTRAVAS